MLKRKFITFLMLLMLAFVLVACGDTGSSEPADEDTAAEVEDAAEDEAAEDEDSEEDAEEDPATTEEADS